MQNDDSLLAGYSPQVESSFNQSSSRTETRCGILSESQDVESYDGTLGVTRGFVNNHEQPVGLLAWNNNLPSLFTSPGNVNGASFGSGTLIGNNLFLTAGHNFDAENVKGWTLPRINGTTRLIPPNQIAQNMSVRADL